jgi:hypothetical protein
MRQLIRAQLLAGVVRCCSSLERLEIDEGVLPVAKQLIAGSFARFWCSS